ncbi:MAG: hypothetical protein HONBIEJF_00223 [Fimbriimonadaceae bacterium]|nr:hypothetical protein [Fimbriimonadaceae bacterium]
MITQEMRARIMDRLKAVEVDAGIRILLAVESGSRAWGFESTDSDYDVRFIYARSIDWYLSIDLESRRDVIEFPIENEIDISGWDVRKALALLENSNPGFIEWLHSPIRYLEQGPFAGEVVGLLPEIYVLERGLFHYRNMATRNFMSQLQGNLVPMKKYLYVLRPLLCCQWIERYREPAPMEFVQLLSLIDDQTALVRAIHRLLEQKRSGTEMSRVPPVPELHDFIVAELNRLKTKRFKNAPNPRALETLNGLFRRTIMSA